MADDKTKEVTKLSKNVEKLVDEIAKLSVIELSELVNALQDKLGVSAAAPIAAAAPAAKAGDAEGGKDEGGGGATNLVMTGAGDNKISVIKALRGINQNWGLKEAKDMTENLPADIIKDGKPDDVKKAAETLKLAGATVEMK
jgi:large subunit ribosomal protein L7/L12